MTTSVTIRQSIFLNFTEMFFNHCGNIFVRLLSNKKFVSEKSRLFVHKSEAENEYVNKLTSTMTIVYLKVLLNCKEAPQL